MEEISQVLQFWFGDIENELASAEQNKLWYQSTPEQDEEIKRRFLPLYLKAVNEQLVEWQTDAKGLIALIILLDQMPRNMFRGTKQAFASDPLALSLAKKCVEQGKDKQLSLIERTFLYHPFEHSEQLGEQQKLCRVV